MAKKPEEKSENNVEVTKENVTFTPEQMALVNEMIAKNVRSSARETGDAQSVYGQRDIKSIDTVNVRRFNGKFVIGFKNHQKDPLKANTPQYLRYGPIPERKLEKEPYITLILSDGKETEEKEILLADYYQIRATDYYQAKVKDIRVKKEIKDHGLLGRSGNMAREVDDKGHLVQRTAIKAESSQETRVFYIELPGFDEPVEFNQDFLA